MKPVRLKYVFQYKYRSLKVGHLRRCLSILRTSLRTLNRYYWLNKATVSMFCFRLGAYSDIATDPIIPTPRYHREFERMVFYLESYIRKIQNR